MTTSDQQLARALRRLAEETPPVADSPEARLATVEALTAELARRPAPARPRRRWLGLAVAASLTAAAAAPLWVRLWPAPARGSAPVEVSRTVTQSGRITSDGTLLALTLPSGVGLVLEPASEVEVSEQGARVILLRGRLAADVTSNEALFLLVSGQTQFATRRARFSASSQGGCDGRPELRVESGTVTIDSATRIEPGEAWPRCPAALRAPEAPEPVVRAKPGPARAPPLRTNAPKPSPPGEERLARQNALYRRALELERSGELSDAVGVLNEVLADGPSALAETALAQKMRWQSKFDPTGARETARDYLRRFPMGFGRAEAETLVLDTR